MKSLIGKSINSEFFRFLVVGVINTLVGYVAFMLLLPRLSYLYAYTLSYGIAVLNAYFMSVFFVFKRKVSLTSFLQFPLIYVLQYFIGAFIMWLLVGQFSIGPGWSYAVVILVTVPINFLATRFLLKR